MNSHNTVNQNQPHCQVCLQKQGICFPDRSYCSATNYYLYIYIEIDLNNEYAWCFQSVCVCVYIYIYIYIYVYIYIYIYLLLYFSFYYLVYIFYLLIFPFIFKSLHFQLCCCCFLVDHKWLEKSLANSGCFSVVISEAWDSFSIEVYYFLTPYDWVILVVF